MLLGTVLIESMSFDSFLFFMPKSHFKKIEYLVNDDKYLSEVFETFSKFTDMIEKSQENIKLFQSQENSTEE